MFMPWAEETPLNFTLNIVAVEISLLHTPSTALKSKKLLLCLHSICLSFNTVSNAEAKKKKSCSVQTDWKLLLYFFSCFWFNHAEMLLFLHSQIPKLGIVLSVDRGQSTPCNQIKSISMQKTNNEMGGRSLQCRQTLAASNHAGRERTPGSHIFPHLLSKQTSILYQRVKLIRFQHKEGDVKW